jgi:hypothetical protein
MTAPSRDDELERFSFKYDPEQVLQPKRSWHWILLGGLFFVALGVAATLGVMHLVSGPSTSVLEPTVRADLRIAGTVDEKALLLIDIGGPSSQIKVATTTTNTVVIQDLTRGRFRAITAALAPQKDRLAYLREEEGHRSAIVIDLDSGSDTKVGEDKLWAAADGATIEPCSWSPIVWSPDSTRFCFFGCDKTRSVLVIVEAETELTPVVVKNTETAQNPPRQVFWLDNQNILYTEFDFTTEQPKVSRIGACSHCAPLSVYER